MKYKYLLLTLVATALCACDGTKKEPVDPVDPEVITDAISVSEKSLALSPELGSTVSVDITTDGDWTLSGMTDGVKEWLEASATEGHGSGTVTFTCTEFNPYDDDRMAVLTFHSGKAQALLLIRQGNDPERNITLSENLLEFEGAAGLQKTIVVNTAKPWTIEGYSEEVSAWLTLSATSGEGNGELVVTTPVISEALEPRQATLTFRIDRVHTADLVVSQACGIELNLNASQLDFTPVAGETLSLGIQCNAVSKSWQIEGADAASEWLDFSATYGTGDASVNITTKSANQDAVRRATFTVRVDEQHSADFTVTQASSMSIMVSPVTLEFAPDQAETKSVTVTATTVSVPWYIEGYTDAVKTWLSIETVSAQALETVVNISTLSANDGDAAREATLRFHLTEDIYDELTISQDMLALKTIVLTWKAGGTKAEPTVKGGEMSPHSKFPWVDTWATLGDVNREWKNGYGGEVVKKGKYDVTATWLFQDYVTKEWVPFELGPIRTDLTTGIYYQNQENTNVRWAWSYIKIPAKAGYRITHIKMTGANAASNATLVFGADKTARNGFLEESASRVTFGKNDPLDREFTTTEANTDYYLGCILDRTFDSFEFTYTEVR